MLTLNNRQRTRRINVRRLRQTIETLLTDELKLQAYELSVQFVDAREITGFNEEFLGHAGSTDVITFNYLARRSRTRIHGDVLVCVDEAVEQARVFGTTWQTELLRYVVHGVLHLIGYNDNTAAARQAMKRHENALVRRLSGKSPRQGLRK